jgi:hypothetical protein
VEIALPKCVHFHVARSTGGFQVLWVPEERVALAITYDYGDDGPVYRWWGNVTHARDFEQFFTPLRPPLVELPYYVGMGITCDQCGERLDTASRALSGRLAEERGDDDVYSYICETCYPEVASWWLKGDEDEA